MSDTVPTGDPGFYDSSNAPRVTEPTSTNPAVSEAVRALSTFGGLGMSRASARRALPLWEHYSSLTEADRQAVANHFPSPSDPDVARPPVENFPTETAW